ncbi:MAG TPA: carboxypeptidase regulatory-like domain-containing protein [Longimicrobiales bacterium]|nr:carboxypeptidase regulatory-like domain-containing protein [Longimicrobiales bacterium]
MPGVLLVVAATLASPAAVTAQAMITLEGVVRHAGGGVAGAQVTAVQRLTGEQRSTWTNDLGFFRVLDLSPGPYAVSTRPAGYTPLTLATELLVDQRAQLDFLLLPDPVGLDTVTVRALRPEAAEIRRMSVSTAVTAAEIRQLPLNTRNVMELAAVAPGIRSFQPVSGRSIPAAGALRDQRAINLYIDGVEMKNLFDGNLVGLPQSGSLLPAEGLQEFRVLVNPYDPEYARGASYIISAVSHRGTNQRHGSVFGFFQDKDLTSVNDFQRGIPNFEKPDFQRRQAGFNLRGPVVRDRLFYAGSYELSSTDHFIAVVPGRPAGDPGRWDQYAGVFPAPNRNHTGLLRLTYAPNHENVLDAIWSVRDQSAKTAFGGIETHDAAVVQEHGVHTLNLRHRWLPTASLANELSLQLVSWAQRQRSLTPGAELRYPTVTIGRASPVFDIDETHLRLVDRATYSTGSGPGSHLLKAGVELARVRASSIVGMNQHGVFRFRDLDTEPYEAAISVGFLHPEGNQDARAALSGWITSFYVNDEWRPTTPLVLNLGIRYDAEIDTQNNDFVVPWVGDTALAALPELQGLLNRGDRRNDLNNFSPRVSFSWDVLGDGSAFLRGGMGIIYDRSPSFVAFAERRAATWRTYVVANPGTTDPEELRRQVLAGGGTAVPPSLRLLPERMDVPENRQWSIGFGMQITPTLTLTTDYIDHRIRKLFASVNLNWLDRSQAPARRVLSADYGDIIVTTDLARGRHRGLLNRISYAPGPRLLVNFAYTLASSRADWDVMNLFVPAAVVDQFYVLQRISGDERHRFVLSGIGTLPAGLAVSVITTVASPRPYERLAGEDLNRNNFFADVWIDGRRFGVPSNSWRNWYRVVDLRLTKNLRVGRGVRLAVTAEGFNILNTQNYSGFFGVQTSPTGEPRPDFGQPSGTFATRQLQLGSRLEF